MLPENADTPYRDLYGMLRYHLGWVDRGFRPLPPAEMASAGGKRLRPTLCLLACEVAGGDYQNALPAAAAIELIHNFSLIHDDIEDDSRTRRHRPTVWAEWGIPQAINAGDTLFVIARLALHRLTRRGISPRRALAVFHTLDQVTLLLCQGQFLDLAFQDRPTVSVDEYLEMVGGKTAAMIAGAARCGALLAGASTTLGNAFFTFGWNLGLAFQIVDDILGIWGEPAVTGKSAASDILTKKKTLPVLYALAATHPAAGHLRQLYSGPLAESDLPAVLAGLDALGARAYAQGRAEEYLDTALSTLHRAVSSSPARNDLEELARFLVHRAY